MWRRQRSDGDRADKGDRGRLNTGQEFAAATWLAGSGGILGPHSLLPPWYRGSPDRAGTQDRGVGQRECRDINIDGSRGFIAIGNEPSLGDSLCEVGIQFFPDDFIEWSVSFSQ